MADHYFGRDAALADLENEPGAVQRQTNRGMAIAKFFKGQVKDEAKSAAQGRICYRDVDMIQIIIPGDKHNVVMRKIKPSDKVNYPKQYEAFRKMEEFVPEGTLIDNWPLLSRSQIEDMKYQGIFTVEQLANLPDDLLQRLGMGARRIRDNAIAFLEAAKTGAVPAKLVSENEALQRANDLLKTQVEDLARRLENLAAEKKVDLSNESDPRSAVAAAENVGRELHERETGNITHVVVPDDYESLSATKLKELAKRIAPDMNIGNKLDALAVIEDYMAEQAAA
jgi:hypothetical protein